MIINVWKTYADGTQKLVQEDVPDDYMEEPSEEVPTTDARISALESENATLKLQIDALQSSVSKVQTDLSTVKTTISLSDTTLLK